MRERGLVGVLEMLESVWVLGEPCELCGSKLFSVHLWRVRIRCVCVCVFVCVERNRVEGRVITTIVSISHTKVYTYIMDVQLRAADSIVCGTASKV